MSFFTRIVSNVREFYSEINAATLTGAIDVIVVEQEDGTLAASPFHVRFGKLGVLKAKEKIVDLEVNGEPVDLHMKLDDTGAAFFVEKVSDFCEEDPLSQELATSPIPDQRKKLLMKDRGTLKPTNIFPENSSGTPMLDTFPPFPQQVSCEVQTDVLEDCGVAPLADDNNETEFSKKGRLNIKKRRRKKQKHSRSGSKSSLKDVMSISATGSDIGDMFLMDDVNDADQEDDDLDESILSSSVPRNLDYSSSFNISNDSNKVDLIRNDSITSQTEECLMENSLIGSRFPLIPKSSSEAEALAALLDQEEELKIEQEILRPKSVAAGFHYFSDGEFGGNQQSTPRPMTPGGILSDSEFENTQRRGEMEQEVWRWGEVPNTSQITTPVAQINIEEELKRESETDNENKERKSWFGWGSASKKEKDASEAKEKGGVYLEELINDPEKISEYLNPISSLPEVVRLPQDEDSLSALRGVSEDREEDLESGAGRSIPMSPASGLHGRHTSSNYESDCEPLADLPSLISRHFPDLAASTCGGLDDKSVTLENFEAHLLTYQQFVERLRNSAESLVADPNLVIRVHEKYLSWNTASPILLSILLFKQPLPGDLVQELIKDGLDVNYNISPEEEAAGGGATPSRSSTWFGWFSGKKTNGVKKSGSEPLLEETPVVEVADTAECSSQTEVTSSITIPNMTEDLSLVKDSSSDTERKEKIELEIGSNGEKMRFRKTLRLSSEQLAALNLMPGSNEVQFSVTTAFQGTTRCLCHIYLWRHTDKLVISDIDGTITKSDVLGHILPVIGRDWAQSGVARLFSKIVNNGYHIMYLSARAIGQASITKEYLQSVKQGDVCLPDGPLFLNPDSLIHAFRREVIDRNPEEFKIRCLKDIQSLFEGKNPFFAGYGNRPNDAFAYAAVGIPVSRIFTINPAGELRHELLTNFQTSYVEQDLMVDQVFPPIGIGFDPEFKVQEFASFGFWRDLPSELDTQDMEALLESEETAKN